MLGWVATAEEDWALASSWAGANPNKVPTTKKATEYTRTIKSSALLLARNLAQLLSKAMRTLYLLNVDYPILVSRVAPEA
jgi:hypothetical protein